MEIKKQANDARWEMKKSWDAEKARLNKHKAQEVASNMPKWEQNEDDESKAFWRQEINNTSLIYKFVTRHTKTSLLIVLTTLMHLNLTYT